MTEQRTEEPKCTLSEAARTTITQFLQRIQFHENEFKGRQDRTARHRHTNIHARAFHSALLLDLSSALQLKNQKKQNRKGAYLTESAQKEPEVGLQMNTHELDKSTENVHTRAFHIDLPR